MGNDVESDWKSNLGKDCKYQILKRLTFLFVGQSRQLKKKIEGEDRDVI